jgi:hypothetical protein
MAHREEASMKRLPPAIEEMIDAAEGRANGNGNGADGEADAEIARLAKLSAVQYERERKDAAKRLGLRAPILDRLIAAERGEPHDKQGRAITFHEPEPWPEPVDGAELLDGIAKAIRLYVVLPDHACDAAALWVVHAYLVDRFLISPRLCVRSPVKQCGKTTLLGVLEALVLRPLKNDNATVAAIFRVVEAHRPTLLLDEGETFITNENSELRGILNSGHRKGGAVLRVVGDDHEVRAFSTFGACVIALIGTLPGTLHDRSVIINLKRKLGTERVQSFTIDCHGHLDMLARKAIRWAQDHGDRVASINPEMPPGIVNREADNWRALLAIADAAAGGWPERARNAAMQAHMAGAMDDAPRLELLLGHIRSIFAGMNEDRISSADLVASLLRIDGAPWSEMGRSRKPLSQNMLARMLKPVGVTPILIGAGRVGGYLLTLFEDAFERYLAPEGVHNLSSALNDDGSSTSDASTTSHQASEREVVECEEMSLAIGSGEDERLWRGVSGEEGPSPPLGRCAQCNGLVADAPLDEGLGVHLHSGRCRSFWLEHHYDA